MFKRWVYERIVGPIDSWVCQRSHKITGRDYFSHQQRVAKFFGVTLITTMMFVRGVLSVLKDHMSEPRNMSLEYAKMLGR